MVIRARHWRSFCVAAALVCSPVVLAQQAKRGNEFQVNVSTTGYQGVPVTVAAPDGDFVVVWKSPHGGDGFDVFARFFASTGVPVTGEFQVNTFTTGYQGFPWAAVEANGDFVVVWESEQDGSGRAVFARLFSSAGSPLAEEFQVNTFTPGNQYRPSVGADADGDFVVTWESVGDSDGQAEGVFGRRFSSTGAALGTQFQVNTFTFSDQRVSSVAADADGDFIVAWQSYGQDGSGLGMFGRRFTSAGIPQAVEFQVNTYTSFNQQYASTSAEPDGDFVIGWYSTAQDGSGEGVFARRFSSAGAGLATELQVNDQTVNNQLVTSLDVDADGDFVVAWSSVQDVESNAIFARRFSSAGTAVALEFEVNTYTPFKQNFPSVTVDADGDFVIAWMDSDQDGSGYGIFAQRFAALATLDIDGNGLVEPLTDALLVLRHLFGFTGTTLTSGAVAVDCTRCDATAIAAYIVSIVAVLDVDDSGEVEPLTDSLLILRRLFGFSGATLIMGATAGDCARCDAPSIAGYVDSLL